MWRFLPIVAVLAAGLAFGPRASAKGGTGPIDVMTPDGEVFTIPTADTEAWWRDQVTSDCHSCGSPQEAARLLERTARTWWRLERSHPPVYLVLPRSWDAGWGRALRFYPSIGRFPAYLVWPGGVGDWRGRWDAWEPATPSMQAIILRVGAPRRVAPGDVPAPDRPLVLPVALGAGLAVTLALRRLTAR